MKNVKIVFAAVLIFFFAGCKSTSSVVSSDVIRIDKTAPKETVSKPAPAEKPVDTVKAPVKDIIDKKVKHRDEYTIALLLPFLEDTIFRRWVNRLDIDNLEDFNFPDESEYSVSFLQGAILALENKSKGFKINLKVYDTKANPVTLSGLIVKLSEDNPDLIIGGWNRDEVKFISDFSKKSQTVFLSPFVPSASVVENNPYYVMLEPTIEQHLRVLSTFMADSFSDASIKILHENTSQGRNYMRMISGNLKENGVQEFAVEEVASEANDRKNFNIGKLITPNTHNVFFIPSFNEGFVHTMLTQLNTQIGKNQITVFGMPTWGDAEILRFRHFNNLNLHLSRSSFQTEATESFRVKFTERYKKDIQESSLMGYDVMNLALHMIATHGVNFEEKLENTALEGVARDFEIHAVTNENGKVVRYENTTLHVVQYQNFEIIHRR
jgi:ABC-type branched-subunit amino acid transport system substrate-binding protein